MQSKLAWNLLHADSFWYRGRGKLENGLIWIWKWFRIHLVKFWWFCFYIDVTCLLEGPDREKLWPRSWKCCPKSQVEGSIFKSDSWFFTIRTDPKMVNNLFIFFQALQRKKLTEKTHASATVTVVRDRKIWTALRTNQIAGFVTVPAWKKKN